MPSLSQAQVAMLLPNNRFSPRNLGQEILALARAYAPQVSGDLANSFSVTISSDGSIEVWSSVSYAEQVEEGMPAVSVPGGKHVSKVKRHKRKTQFGRTIVRAHTKTFDNKKPVEVTGSTNPRTQEWRTLGPSGARKGLFFIKRAVEDAIENWVRRA